MVSAVPLKKTAAEWDLYWAIVLDPALRDDLRNERDLLVAEQSSFMPGDLFEFNDIPGRSFLRNLLKIDSLSGLARYRRKNDSLPRLIIVPSGFGVRGTVEEPDAGPAPAKPGARFPGEER